MDNTPRRANINPIRTPAAAGTLYPVDPAGLRNEIAGLLREAMRAGPIPKALIVPHAGYQYSGPVASSGYVLLRPIRQRIQRVMVVGPSHRVRDYGGPELLKFAEAAHIYKQVRGSIPRKVPLPSFGVIGEAVSGIHVSKTGDRGTETFREWLNSESTSA